MATEKTKLLGKSFDYRTNVSLPLAMNKKLDECVVVMPRPSQFHHCDNNGSAFGLTLDELLPYKDDPFWVRIRQTIMILFGLIFIAMFTTSCIISIVEDKQRCAINTTKTTLSIISMSGGVFKNIL